MVLRPPNVLAGVPRKDALFRPHEIDAVSDPERSKDCCEVCVSRSPNSG